MFILLTRDRIKPNRVKSTNTGLFVTQEVERKRVEEKAKKEAILQEYQMRKAEEDLPPQMRANFRQKQSKKAERPASVHWTGLSSR